MQKVKRMKHNHLQWISLTVLKIIATAPMSGQNLHFPKEVVKKFEVKHGELMGFFEDENGQLFIKKANS